MSQRTQLLLVAFLLLLAIVSIYLPSLHYQFIGLDDDELITHNPDIKFLNFDRLSHLLSHPYITLYIPITMLTYAVDYQIWHLTPFGFRFMNLVIHFLNAVLVFYLLRLIQKKSWFAFTVAFLFAIHPVQIESVVWVAERKNVLSTFFLFSALVSYWNAVCSSAAKQRRGLLISIGFFLPGLLSKPSVVIFPILVFLINYFYFDNRHDFRGRAWFYVGVLLLCALVTSLTIFGTATDVEKYSFHGNSYLINLFVMITVFWRYWAVLLFPYHQNILYTSPVYRSISNPMVLFSTLGILLFLIILWTFRKKEKTIVFWFAWFLVGLIPVSNLIAPLPSIMNDRYLYVPIIGFWAALICLIERLSKGFFFGANSVRSKITTVSLLASLAIPYSVLTVQRIPEWKTAETLWESALKRAPRPDARIYYFFGINQLDNGNFERSVTLLKKSLALHPLTDTLLALGTACVAAERFDEAENYLKQVIKQDPKRAGAYDQLGVVYRKLKRSEEAQPLFKQAIRLQPRNAVLYNNYALLLMDMGQVEQARQNWEYALSLDPDCHFALRNLAWFHYLRHEWGAAAFYLIRYLRREPTDKQMLDLIPVIEPKLTGKKELPVDLRT